MENGKSLIFKHGSALPKPNPVLNEKQLKQVGWAYPPTVFLPH